MKTAAVARPEHRQLRHHLALKITTTASAVPRLTRLRGVFNSPLRLDACPGGWRALVLAAGRRLQIGTNAPRHGVNGAQGARISSRRVLLFAVANGSGNQNSVKLGAESRWRPPGTESPSAEPDGLYQSPLTLTLMPGPGSSAGQALVPGIHAPGFSTAWTVRLIARRHVLKDQQTQRWEWPGHPPDEVPGGGHDEVKSWCKRPSISIPCVPRLSGV